MRSKFLVLAACVWAAVAAVEPAPVQAAPTATASLGGATATPAATTPPTTTAAVQVMAPRDDGIDAGAVRPTANTSATPAPPKPAEPDPSQSPFPVSETILLLAGVLTVGFIVRRRN